VISLFDVFSHIGLFQGLCFAMFLVGFVSMLGGFFRELSGWGAWFLQGLREPASFLGKI
jgi:hypothetical protein